MYYPDVASQCRKIVVSIYSIQVLFLIAMGLGFSQKTPFLDQQLISCVPFIMLSILLWDWIHFDQVV